MRIRQSELKTWGKCPLMLKFARMDGIRREQSASLTYGSILHHCVQWMEERQDVEGAVDLFKQLWVSPTLLDPTYEPTYYVLGTSWRKYMEAGPEILRRWWQVVSWDSALVLAREHHFVVPIGEHELEGTVDKVEIGYVGAANAIAYKTVDYKTDRKVPTYGFLEEDLQFTVYSYASLQREFWTGIGGDDAWQRYLGLRRFGEWIQLTGPKRMDAGERVQRHYNRLAMAVDQIAASMAMGIYPPNISGEHCRYCDFRAPCGLPVLDGDGNEIPFP